MRSSDSAFDLASPEALEEALSRVLEEVGGRRQPLRTTTVSYLDTFDWRLKQKGGELAFRRNGGGSVLTWTPAAGGSELRSMADVAPTCASELPPGPLSERLRGAIEPRRLLVRAQIQERSVSVDVLGPEKKTVCRVHGVQAKARRNGVRTWTPLPPRLRLQKLKGYENESTALERFLRFRLGLSLSDEDELGAALSALGEKPGRDPSELALTLEPSMTTLEGVKAILRRLYEIMRVNEKGVLDEIDIEFLHDFRVAVRRTRSVLGQVGSVFPEPLAEHYKAEFRWLGSVTGPVRDLDVFFERLEDYAGDLPVGDRSALEPLEEHLVEERSRSCAALKKALKSRRYGQLCSTWAQALEPGASPGAVRAKAERPVTEVASARIWKRYRRILRRGRAIGAGTPSAELHRLRIEAKRLRYLLEVFRSLFPADAFTGALKSLKRIQTCLGDFNDYVVHEDMLRRSAESLGSASPSTILALGRMTAGLEKRRNEARNAFTERFKSFDDRAHRKAFRKLFHSEQGSS